MEITKYFKESVEVENFDNDYVEIKMSYENYIDLFYLLDGIKIKDGLNRIHLNQIEKKILKEMKDAKVKEVWF